MNKKLYKPGIGVLVVGIILIIGGYIFTGEFVYNHFKSDIFNKYPLSVIIILLGVTLFLLGVFLIIIFSRLL
jgi:hypothetical protein